jgi:sec-independent protein translocase protein TatA
MIQFLPLGFLGGSMSGGEIMIILVAMLLLFGAKKLPSIARNLGQSMETFRRASREVTHEIMTADAGSAPGKTLDATANAGEEPASPVIRTPEQTVVRDESSRS